jgi:hypothetical protein
MSEYAADSTLVEILDELRANGFTEEFRVDDEGSVCCRVCGHCQPAGSVDLEGLRRVEGASDPGDMAAVLALSCPNCGRHGTAVVRFGPEAGPGDIALLTAQTDDHADGGPAVER